MHAASVKLATVAAEFVQLSHQILVTLRKRGSEIEDIAIAIEAQLTALRERPLLRLAFIGQYSAGKSTIVRALTGREDIPIGAGITTDRATDYQWSEVVLLTDTPGLYTGNDDHDLIAKEAIRRADLLVFVVTNELPTLTITEKFKELAFDEHYYHKMFLVVNKMSREDGLFDELVTIYTRSFAELIAPFPINSLRVAFIDARDYLEGDLEASHFDDFIAALNKFVDQKGRLGQLHTPIQEVLSLVLQARNRQIPAAEGLPAVLMLERLEHKVTNALKMAETDKQEIVIDLCGTIVMAGQALAAELGEQPEVVAFQQSRDRTIVQLEQAIDAARSKVEAKVKERLTELEDDFIALIQSDIGLPVLEAIRIARQDKSASRSFAPTLGMANGMVRTYGNFSLRVLDVTAQLTGGKQGMDVLLGVRPAYDAIQKLGNLFRLGIRSWQQAKVANFAMDFVKTLTPWKSGLETALKLTAHKLR